VRLDLTNRLLAGADLDEALPLVAEALRDLFSFTACRIDAGDTSATVGAFDGLPALRSRAADVTVTATADHEVSVADRALLDALVAGLATSVDRLRLQHDVQQARLASEMDRQRASLHSAVSHNLRTPLSVVRVAADTMRSSWGQLEPEERRELLATISYEAKRLERIVRNTLELSRIGSGALQLEPQAVDVTDLLQGVVRRVRPITHSHDVRIEVDERVPAVMWDVVAVDQMLLNLLENALRYAPAGSEIVVGARPGPDGWVELRVSDHGPGVPPEARARIFEEFQSAERRPQQAGTGLGLAIVRGLARVHGGTVRYEDTPGGGATFVCALPAGG
jgi:two-component system sensor histidine kinase KdpD